MSGALQMGLYEVSISYRMEAISCFGKIYVLFALAFHSLVWTKLARLLLLKLIFSPWFTPHLTRLLDIDIRTSASSLSLNGF